MCVRSGSRCPGPLEGPLIVDMTASAKDGMRRRRALQPTRKSWDPSVYLDRIDVQGSVEAIIIEAFYRDFLTYFTTEGEGEDIQNKLTWLQLLPNLAADTSDYALVLALQSTATAYGGIMTLNTPLTQHARHLYGIALQTYYHLLKQSRSRTNFTVHMVSTSVLFSFFEAMQATTAEAYLAHIYGAARLLEVTGPGQCAHGVLCQLFYHVRTQMLFAQLATEHHNVPVAVRNILFDLLSYKDPPLIQRLMCCIAALQELHAQSSDQNHSSLALQVQQLWNGYLRQKTSQNPRWYDASRGTVLFDDAFAALTMAYFSSAHIFLTQLIQPGAAESQKAAHYHRFILDAATYLDTTRNAIAYMRMATPLLLVALHSPDHAYRKTAIETFRLWSKGCMRGISTLALNALRRQEGRTYDVRGCDRVPELPLPD